MTLALFESVLIRHILYVGRASATLQKDATLNVDAARFYRESNYFISRLVSRLFRSSPLQNGFLRDIVSAYVYNIILHSCSARSIRHIHYFGSNWRIGFIRILFRLRLLLKIIREVRTATYSWNATRPLEVVAYRFPEHAFELTDGISESRCNSLRSPHLFYESFGDYLILSGHKSATTVESYRARGAGLPSCSGLSLQTATKVRTFKKFFESLFFLSSELQLPSVKLTGVISRLFNLLYLIRAARHMDFIRKINQDGGTLFYLNSTGLDFGYLYLSPKYSKVFKNFAYSTNWDGGLTKLGSTLDCRKFACETERTLRGMFSVECYGAIGASAGYGGNYAVANMIRALVMRTGTSEPPAEPIFVESIPTMLGFVATREGIQLVPRGDNDSSPSAKKASKKILFIDPSIYSPGRMSNYTPVPNDCYREERIESIYKILLRSVDQLDLSLDIRPKYSMYRYENHHIYSYLRSQNRVRFLSPSERLYDNDDNGYLIALQLPFSSTKAFLEAKGLKSIYLIDDSVDRSSLEYLSDDEFVHINKLITYLSGIL